MAVAAAVGQKIWWNDFLALTREPEPPDVVRYVLQQVAELKKYGSVKVHSRILKEAVEQVAYAKGLTIRTREVVPGAWRIELLTNP